MAEQYRILIVDDNPKNIQVAANILNSKEYQLGFAKSGEEVLERLSKNSYDLILMDVMMPGIDGFETARHVKNMKEHKQIPIIFVTAKTEDEDIIEGFYSGGVDYVTKPYRSSELLARVNAHLALKSYRDKLEERVKEETQKRLAQQELLVRQSRLAAMGEMMSAITHQWNQPLSIISICANSVEMMLDSGEIDVDEIKRNNSYLLKSLRFMTQTMHDFKGFFVPSKKKQEFFISNEIDAIVELLAPLLKQHSIDVSKELDQKLKLYGVPGEFKQVLLNLISNAKDAIIAKYGNKGRGKISIKAFSQDGHTMIEIADNGGGVPQEVLPYIFDDYFTTKGENGTGIGLSMSKMIIKESFGGDIYVKNGYDGALFRVEIPTTEAVVIPSPANYTRQ